MHRPHGARAYRQQAGSDGGGDAEVGAVGDLHEATAVIADLRRIGEREGEGELRRACLARHGRLHLGERSRHLALEDPAILQRDILERLGWHAEILGQHIGRRVRHPVGGRQCVELRRSTIVEGEHELAAVRTEPLQRMRQAGRKIPKIALSHIGNIRTTFHVEHGYAAVAVGHDRPLGLLVPMQFTDAAGGEPHVDAGNLAGDREVGLRDLASPAAVLDAPRREIKRGPELRHAANIRGRWLKERRHCVGQRGIVRARNGQRIGVGDVDGTLRWQIGIAERGSARHRHRGGTRRSCRQNMAT